MGQYQHAAWQSSIIPNDHSVTDIVRESHAECDRDGTTDPFYCPRIGDDFNIRPSSVMPASAMRNRTLGIDSSIPLKHRAESAATYCSRSAGVPSNGLCIEAKSLCLPHSLPVRRVCPSHVLQLRFKFWAARSYTDKRWPNSHHPMARRRWENTSHLIYPHISFCRSHVNLQQNRLRTPLAPPEDAIHGEAIAI